MKSATAVMANVDAVGFVLLGVAGGIG